ncbi:hypothetical protein [Microvirga flavescens]|uniref:hypothetical protein n=1 Tax=Microvirga flavescens TaxID=2249811 RepID=UPI000DD61340|nr:hypothetical protein [Microvirga flavescens]
MNTFSRTSLIEQRSVVQKQVNLWASFLPLAFKRIVQRERACVVVRIVQGGFTATPMSSRLKKASKIHWQEEGGRWQPEASLRQLLRIAQERPVDLELPPDFILSHSVTFPRAALTNLSDAIKYGLPSWSPFQDNDVYVNGSVTRVQSEQAMVCLHYALRAKIDPVLARLDAIGLTVDRIVLDTESNCSVTLPTSKLDRIRRARRVDGGLAAIAVSLAVLLGSFQVALLSSRLENAEIVLRSEIAQFRKAEALQAAYTSFAARRLAVSERRAKEISVYELLVVLAQHLPDGVAVKTLEIGNGQGRLELSGGDPDEILQALRTISILSDLKIEPMRATHSSGVTFELARKVP